jgi:uncharacterized membrane protein YhaH (DUF805 family)
MANLKNRNDFFWIILAWLIVIAIVYISILKFQLFFK